MILRPMALLAGLVGGLAAPLPLAAACSCPRPSLEDLIEDGRDLSVFSARVVSVLSPAPGTPTVTRLSVTEVIKGRVPRTLEMTGITAADHSCGIDLRPGEERTLAAYRKEGAWFTDLCLVPRL